MHFPSLLGCIHILFLSNNQTLLTLFFSYVWCGPYSTMECFSVTSASNRLYQFMFSLWLPVYSFVRKIDIPTSYMYTSRHKCILKFPNLCYSTLLSFWIWWQWRCSFHGLQKSLPVYNVYKISCIQIGGSGEVDRKVQFLFSFVMVHSLNIYIFVPSNQISVGTCIIFVPSSAPVRTHWSCLITEVNLSPIDPVLV